MNDLIRGIPFKFEPKRINRFFAKFDTDIGIEQWKVQKFDRPKMKINSVPIKFYNEQNYVSGQYNWDPLTITLLDPIAPSTGIEVMEWVRKHAESLTGRMGYASHYKKDIELIEGDPGGNIVSRFYLEQCLITSVDFGSNDYTSDELSNITLTIQPWRCILNY